ncbi:hypothetical protein [Rubripirellula lacrimiformis]|uniref:hypothetical protein n=1 Tax=Rubripirellula lacrimiformis TaxID=1930273 RepID=UPI001C54F0C4|nr:hypothetical protein [Rubripirellula lacrimiformis]
MSPASSETRQEFRPTPSRYRNSPRVSAHAQPVARLAKSFGPRPTSTETRQEFRPTLSQ